MPVHALTPDAANAATAEEADDSQWLNRDEIARLAGVDRQTIDRDVKAHGLTSRPGPNGSKRFWVRDFLRIGRLCEADLPTGLTATQAVEVLNLRHEIARLTRDNGELTGRLDELRARLIELSNQLKVKDDQIRSLESLAIRCTKLIEGGRA